MPEVFDICSENPPRDLKATTVMEGYPWNLMWNLKGSEDYDNFEGYLRDHIGLPLGYQGYPRDPKAT